MGEEKRREKSSLQLKIGEFHLSVHLSLKFSYMFKLECNSLVRGLPFTAIPRSNESQLNASEYSYDVFHFVFRFRLFFFLFRNFIYKIICTNKKKRCKAIFKLLFPFVLTTFRSFAFRWIACVQTFKLNLYYMFFRLLFFH